MQIPDVDCTKKFSPVAAVTTLRTLILINLWLKWIIKLIDFEAKFLNTNLEELLYVKWVKGMVELGYITPEQAFCWCAQCIKALYGSVQPPRAWFFTFIATLSLLRYK